MSKYVVAYDVDCVLNDLVSKMLNKYNERFGASLQVEDITNYDITQFAEEKNRAEMRGMFFDLDLWRSLTPIEGSVKYLSLLATNPDIDLYLVTATHSMNFHTKVEWLIDYFPFIPRENIVCLHNKRLFNCDVLVDDYDKNLRGGFFRSILFDAPWNRNVDTEWTTIERAHNHEEAYQLVMAYFTKDMADDE